MRPCPGFLRPDPAASVVRSLFLFLLDSRGPSWHPDFLSDTSRPEHMLGQVLRLRSLYCSHLKACFLSLKAYCNIDRLCFLLHHDVINIRNNSADPYAFHLLCSWIRKAEFYAVRRMDVVGGFHSVVIWLHD